MKNETKIIKKINDLYVLKRKKFLLMLKDGQYITVEWDGKDKRKQIMDWRVKNHLDGKETLGVFAGSEFTKFICFDIDVKNQEMAKWTVYKLIHTLINIGIPEEYIYISMSGSKGYHVEIFFTKPVHNKDIYKFYLMALNEAELLNIDYGQVELRPLEGNGVKISLGKHMKTGNTCWYCEYEGLTPIKEYEYILTIKQLDSQFFYDLLNMDDFNITEKQAIEFETNIKDKYKPLSIYKENIDETATIEAIEKLFKTGLTMKGTRHNSLLKIAKYYKYNGFDLASAKEVLVDWMGQQDKRLYTTAWEDVIKDIDGICEWVYKNNINLTKNIRSEIIEVSKQEIEDILKIKGKSERLVIYSLLIHKKRYATDDGIFYMTYPQMVETTGLHRDTVIEKVKVLERLNHINVTRDDGVEYDIVSRKPKSKPNKYKINHIGSEIVQGEKMRICDKNCTGCFNACLCNMYTDKELKVVLSRRQYDEVIKFRDYCKAL